MENNQDKELNRGLRLLAKSSFVVFITLILSKLLVYLYRIIIARHYGPEIYGLFALSIIFVSWFRLIFGLGLKDGLLRYVSLFKEKKEKNQIKYLFNKSFFILIFTGILASALLFLSSNFIASKIFSNPDLVVFLKIFSLAIPFTILGAVFLSVIRAFEKIYWFSFISYVFGNLVNLIILGILIFLGNSSISIPISYLSGTLFIFIVSYFVFKKTILPIFKLGKGKNNPKNKKVFNEMFSYSWPFIFSGVVIFIFSWVDSFMIGIFKTIEHVGFYNAAVPIAMLLMLPLNLFGQLFLPLVTKEYSKGNLEIVKQLSQQVGKWVFMIAAPFFILLVVFPGAFINLLFGADYLVAENALRFLAIGTLISAIFGISQEILSMSGKSKTILINVIFATALNILLNFILVPLYGITGAGFATMVSLIFLNILFSIQSYKHFSIIPLKKKMLKVTLIIILSTILLFIVKSFININLLSITLCGIFFITVYVLLVLTTNCLDRNDWYILKLVLNKMKNK